MKQTWLKNIRKVLATGFFIFTLIIFLDFTGLIPPQVDHVMTFIQFTPSLVEFVHLLGHTSLGFLIVIVLTLLFGRVYCSTLCPAGVFQDGVILVRRKISKKKKFRHLKARNILRLTILGVVVLSVPAGTMALVNLLDPYSLFGRISVELFRPVVVSVNNLLSQIFESFHNYFFKPVEVRSFATGPFLIALVFLGILIIFPILRGRQYCNSLCPVGTLLGYLSKFSLYRIHLDKALCTRCGDCMFACKAGCIDVKNRSVDLSRCVACYNCLTVCSANGIHYTPFWKKNASDRSLPGTDLSKRNFFLTSALLLGSLVSVQGQHRHRGGGHGRGRQFDSTREDALPVSPPGSISHHHFVNACTGCFLCVSACPTQVLQPRLAAYGWQGLFQPVMDYKVSFCNYDCVVCTKVCPAAALLPLTIDEKKQVQMGKARFIKRECVVFTKNTACGACSEHCPTKAVQMVPYQQGLTIPEVNPDICIGCGACEYACPTDPKAIVVDANTVHLKAMLPEETETEKEVDYKEEFPF
ncbi:MAG TPA: 4Fe-4S dicluster domain-containing protein [Bacteroidales bacterium]|nr:4Fe-4S dicluster domain-containing protein [Bacteroidales bacterium]